jgi:phosphate transport system ATP-binding protein
MTPELKPHICVRDLSVRYGAHHALKGVSVDIPDRKITAVLGPSGCGKTTFLRCLNRLVDSVDGVRVSGQVLVDGEDLFGPQAEVTHIRRKMGLLSQRPYPLPMSIYDNVAYGPRLHGQRDRKQLDALVERHLVLAGLWEEVRGRLGAPASSLSIGQQQRLCLARGLAVEPEIILADEPTSALDPVSSTHIEKKFRELRDRYTVVIVTHILRQARRLADYVMFMYMGELVEHGPAQTMFENPQKQQTREYMAGVIS